MQFSVLLSSRSAIYFAGLQTSPPWTPEYRAQTAQRCCILLRGCDLAKGLALSLL